MSMPVQHGPNCQGTKVIRHGTTGQGKQRYRCQDMGCHGRTCLLDDSYAGHAAEIKQQIVDLAMHASGYSRARWRVPWASYHRHPSTSTKSRR